MKNKKDEKKIQTVAVIGLGYVGLPLAIRCAEKGYQVIGIDNDKKKVATLLKGKSPIQEEFIKQRLSLLKKIKLTTNPKQLKKTNIVIICVPTPIDNQFFPNLGPLKKASEVVAKNLKKGQLVIVESTINPGVCEEVVEPIFALRGLREGKDYFLVHCPERIDPGNKKWNISNIPRVVGSLSKKGLSLAKKFYQSIIDADIKPMASIRSAEAVKIVENSFRDINIAFVNELAQSFDRFGIDIKDVIDGAATKPFAFLPHYPSRGVGGHCIPVDPYYLIERAKKNGFDHRFLRTAREINNYMPLYTVELMQDLLNELELPLKGTRIGVLGLSYKANVGDLRESPSKKIIKALKEKNAQVICFDPFFPDLSDVKNINQFLQKVEAFILATNHQVFLEIDLNLFKKYKIKAIVDGTNSLNKEKIKKMGIKYRFI